MKIPPLLAAVLFPILLIAGGRGAGAQDLSGGIMSGAVNLMDYGAGSYSGAGITLSSGTLFLSGENLNFGSSGTVLIANAAGNLSGIGTVALSASNSYSVGTTILGVGSLTVGGGGINWNSNNGGLVLNLTNNGSVGYLGGGGTLTLSGSNSLGGGSLGGNTLTNGIGGLNSGGAPNLSVALVANGNLYVGSNSSGQTLNLTSGTNSFSNTYISYNTGDSNNQLNVTGTKTVLTNSANIFIGYSEYGGSGTLTVANGGSVIAGEGIILASNGGSVGTLNIGSLGGNDRAGTITTPTISFGSGSGTLNFNQADSFTLTSSISVRGTIQQLGSGTTIITGNIPSSASKVGVFVNNGTLQIGNGSSSNSIVGYNSQIYGDYGGTGGTAVTVTNRGNLLISTNSFIAGGHGGSSQADFQPWNHGGRGGIGVNFWGIGSLINSGTISGGDSGLIGYSEPGGIGVYFGGMGSLINSGTISGGKSGSEYFGEEGGIGVYFGGMGTLKNSGTISGGNLDSEHYTEGAGATGVSFAGSGTLMNSGTISGGNGTNLFHRLGLGGIGVSFGDTGTLVNSGTISGGANGSGELALGVVFSGNSNTFVNLGGGTINGGVSMAGGNNSLTLFTGSVINGGLNIGTDSASSLTLDGQGTATWSSTVTVTGTTTFGGSLIKQGVGTWILDRPIGNLSSTRVEAGILQFTSILDVDNSDPSGTGTLTIGSEASVISSNIIIASSINSTGILNIGTFGGNDTNVSLTASQISFGSGSGMLNFNQADTAIISSFITGTNPQTLVQQLGNGTTILTGNNSYAGTTAITAGTLVAANSTALGASAVTLGNGPSSATLALANNITNLTISSLNWGANGTLSLTPGVQQLSITGALTNSGGGAFNFVNALINNATNTLLSFGSQSGFTTNSFSVVGLQGYSFALTSNTLSAYIAPNANLVLSTNLILNNSLTVKNLTVQSLTITATGGFSGAGTLTGNLMNSGTLLPGNTNGTGTLSVSGTLTLAPSSTYLLPVSGTNSPQLQVGGAATLGGTLNIISLTTGRLILGAQLPILTASTITGAFSSIEAPAGYRGRLEIVGDPTALLIIAPASYTQLAVNRNQSNLATALNSFIPATSGDKLVVSTALDSLAASQYQAAFNAIAPTLYQSMSTIAFNLANAQNSELLQRLWGVRVAGTGFSMSGFADNTAVIEGQGDGPEGKKGVLDSKRDILRPGLDNHWGMFVDGNGIFAVATSANMLPSYTSQSGGITTGLTYKWNESFGTGIYAGYEGSYAKYKNNGVGSGSTLIDNSVRFGVFGTYGRPDGKGFYADALAGGGYNNYAISRTIAFGTTGSSSSINRTANSSPGAAELDTMLAGGYDLKQGNFTYGPTTSLQYTYFGANAINETGAQSLDFHSSGWNTSSLLYSLGAHAAYTWQASKNIVVVPQVSLSWQHEFLQNPYAISGNLGGSPSFSNWSSTPLRDTLYTGVGFTVELAKRWNTSLFYNASAGNNNLVSQNIFWSAGVKF